MSGGEPEPERPPRSRRDLEEIFGDVLPATTSDQRDPGPPAQDDDWYHQNRPPHHDRDA